MNKKLIIHHLSFIIRKSSGFTLIELLVAISIIGILSSLLLANFVGIRQRARDGVRKSDLRQIQAALELYRSDQGTYPLTAAFPACSSSLTDGGTPPAVTIYMQKIPCDPINSTPYVYTYDSSDGETYSLYSCLENVNDAQKDDSNNADYCTGDENWSYTLHNP